MWLLLVAASFGATLEAQPPRNKPHGSRAMPAWPIWCISFNLVRDDLASFGLLRRRFEMDVLQLAGLLELKALRGRVQTRFLSAGP